ncbi:MAG: DUF503 domain-containing protein [Anaerolineales bacterium]|jgi:uncharacterized protein YlxP (DUF503 family)
MPIGLLILHLHLPGCSSLKEKRGRLKPLLAKLHKDYNASTAEVDHLDVWQDAVIACAVVSNDGKHTQRVLQKIATWVDTSWRDVDVVSEEIEML